MAGLGPFQTVKELAQVFINCQLGLGVGVEIGLALEEVLPPRLVEVFSPILIAVVDLSSLVFFFFSAAFSSLVSNTSITPLFTSIIISYILKEVGQNSYSSTIRTNFYIFRHSIFSML
nr:hypothetical protein DBT50_000990 [Aerococcus tenax]